MDTLHREDWWHRQDSIYYNYYLSLNESLKFFGFSDYHFDLIFQLNFFIARIFVWFVVKRLSQQLWSCRDGQLT